MSGFFLNNNKERREYFEKVVEDHSLSGLREALNSLSPEGRKVLSLHYKDGYTLKEISELMNKSISVIRNHHNRSIYLLYRYFNPHLSEKAKISKS